MKMQMIRNKTNQRKTRQVEQESRLCQNTETSGRRIGKSNWKKRKKKGRDSEG